jgi:hypothetical protein
VCSIKSFLALDRTYECVVGGGLFNEDEVKHYEALVKHGGQHARSAQQSKKTRKKHMHTSEIILTPLRTGAHQFGAAAAYIREMHKPTRGWLILSIASVAC